MTSTEAILGNVRGRGAETSPAGRFEKIAYQPEWEDLADFPAGVSRTEYLRDTTRSIISYNESPDIPFNASFNPYRGCEHGCIYCYARPYHEYLGFSAGLDFETKIFVKEDAPELLRKEMENPRWRPQLLGISGVTDCYQPVEKKLEITRRCLEVMAEFRNPVGVITKNALIRRDIDLLKRLSRHNAALAILSITTLDDGLRRLMEPRTSSPGQRLEVLRDLSVRSVPAGVMVGPVIPGLTDHELPAIIEAAAAAGASFASYIMLRLPHGVGDLFEAWLRRHFPNKAEKVLNRLREMHGGQLSDSRFGVRMKGEGHHADQIRALFEIACKRTGLNKNRPSVSSAAFRRPGAVQQSLF